MNQDPTIIWAGLCLFLAVTSYFAGYTRRASDEETRRTNSRRTPSARYLEKL
jgi:hypothetical protein